MVTWSETSKPCGLSQTIVAVWLLTPPGVTVLTLISFLTLYNQEVNLSSISVAPKLATFNLSPFR